MNMKWASKANLQPAVSSRSQRSIFGFISFFFFCTISLAKYSPMNVMKSLANKLLVVWNLK